MNIDSVLKDHGIGVSGGSNIKSMQKGIATYQDVTSLDIAIATIDLTKAIVIIELVSSGTNYTGTVAAKFTSSSNVNISTYSSTSNAMLVNWWVIEFNNVKSLQSGSKTWSTTTNGFVIKPVTIASVVPLKSLCFVTVKTNYGNAVVGPNSIVGMISSPTNLNLSVYDQPGDAEWQIIEFN